MYIVPRIANIGFADLKKFRQSNKLRDSDLLLDEKLTRQRDCKGSLMLAVYTEAVRELFASCSQAANELFENCEDTVVSTLKLANSFGDSETLVVHQIQTEA